MAGASTESSSTGGHPGLLERLGEAPDRAAWGLLAAFAAAYPATAALTGNLGALGYADGASHLDPMTRANSVLAAVAAFSLWAGLALRGAVARDLRELAPVLDLSAAELRERLGWVRSARHGSWPAVAAGAAVALAITVYSNHRLQGGWPWSFDFHDWWNLSLMLLLFGLMGELCHASWSVGALLSRLGRDHARVRLLGRAELRPFVRCGVRLGRNWFIGSAIAMLLLLDLRLTGVVIAVLLLTLGLGVASLILPCFGVHQRLRQAKRTELARLRAAIEARSEALFSAGPDPDDDSRLPALLAYESRVQQAGEWPFDTPTLLRFALLVLIPIASWVAGALVERLVDAVLG